MGWTRELIAQWRTRLSAWRRQPSCTCHTFLLTDEDCPVHGDAARRGE